MLSRRKILSAMAGVAMLAMPVTALAAHHNDHSSPRPFVAQGRGFQRPNAWHDQGFHNGWAKHRFASAAPFVNGGRYYATPRVAPNWYDRHEDRNEYRTAGNYWAVPARPVGWHDGDADDWGRRNYRCASDGDNCQWTNNGGSRYWQNYGGYDYGAPYSWYQAQPPTAYAPSQQLGWLIARRQRAMATIAQMRARGDNRGAARMVTIVNGLDRRIASLRGYGNNDYNGYLPSAAYVPPVSNYGYGSPLTSILGGAPAPYYGNPSPYYTNNSYYGGNGYYGNSPTTTALVSMLPYLLGAH